MASGIRFREVVKKIEKFWDAGPGSGCLRCCGIGHKCLGNFKDRPKKCVMYTEKHQASKYQYEINGYSKETKKLCVHVVPQCTNC